MMTEGTIKSTTYDALQCIDRLMVVFEWNFIPGHVGIQRILLPGFTNLKISMRFKWNKQMVIIRINNLGEWCKYVRLKSYGWYRSMKRAWTRWFFTWKSPDFPWRSLVFMGFPWPNSIPGCDLAAHQKLVEKLGCSYGEKCYPTFSTFTYSLGWNRKRHPKKDA